MPARMPARSPALASLALLLAACSSAPPPPAERPPATPAPAAQPVAIPEPAADDPGPPSPFSVAAVGQSDDMFLAPLAGGHAFLITGKTVFDLEGDDVAYNEKRQAGLDQIPGALIGAGGAWPKSAWVATIEQLMRAGTSVLYRWEGLQWVPRRNNFGAQYGNSILLGFGPWSKGRTLALIVSQMGSGARFDVIDGSPAAPPKIVGPRTGGCSARVQPVAFASLESGEIFMAGRTCTDAHDAYSSPTEWENERWAVERWAAGAGKSKIDELPPLGSVTAIVALAPNDVYVGGNEAGDAARPALLHFDGTAWTTATPPGEGSGPFSALSKSPEGTLYAIVDGAVWSRVRGEPWERMRLPHGASGPMAAQQLWPRGDGDLWVLASGGLLHTRPPTKQFDLAAFDSNQPDAHDVLATMPKPPSPSCKTPFVLLYTLGKNAPEEYDYPATRAAIKGHPEFKGKVLFIEFERGERRMLGARVKDFKAGQALADLVRQKVPSSTPQLACHDPKPKRTLIIDFKTGDLDKFELPEGYGQN
jgi:hypothetical protein